MEPISQKSSNQGLASLLGGRRGHFQMESGHHSELWFELERLCLQPPVIRPLAEQLAARLRGYEVEIVCGPLIEGAFVALLVALELGCEFAYAERFQDAAREGLFPVEYRVPAGLRAALRGRRVAIINDVISAGSAVRGTFSDLQSLGANVVAMGALLALGDAIDGFANEHHVSLELFERMENNLWTPAECPLCRDSVALEIVGTS